MTNFRKMARDLRKDFRAMGGSFKLEYEYGIYYIVVFYKKTVLKAISVRNGDYIYTLNCVIETAMNLLRGLKK